MPTKEYANLQRPLEPAHNDCASSLVEDKGAKASCRQGFLYCEHKSFFAKNPIGRQAGPPDMDDAWLQPYVPKVMYHQSPKSDRPRIPLCEHEQKKKAPPCGLFCVQY
jgi:hypothetical protein